MFPYQWDASLQSRRGAGPMIYDCPTLSVGCWEIIGRNSLDFFATTVYKMMDSIDAWSDQLKYMLNIIICYFWMMDGVHTREVTVWQAIHILLESILRHLLLRNDHLCKSFEMVPWLCMSSRRPCSNDKGIQLKGCVFFFPDSSFTKVVNQVVKKPTSEMELVDLEMYIEELLGWILNIVDIVVLGRIDSCSSCGACGSDDMAIYHTISRPCNCISISFHPHHTQKIWKWCEIHHQFFQPSFLLAPKTGRFQTHSKVSHHWSQWVAEGVR